MDYEVVIFWLVCVSCLSALVMIATRARSAGRGWVMVYLTILLVSGAGRLAGKSELVYVGLAMWLVLVLCPGLLSRICFHQFLQQRYATARRLARIIGWLHPADGLRQQPEVIHALELAQRGDLAAATEMLQRYQGVRSSIGMAAVVNLYRMTNNWEGLLAWQSQNSGELERHPQLLAVLLRAQAEVGDLRGMVVLYDQNKHRIAKLVPAASRDMCRLALFAFCGKRALVERLFAGSLAMLPVVTREFWLATADLASGATEIAKHRLEELLSSADPTARRAIERRLSRISIQFEPLDASGERIVEEAARDSSHDESFGAQRSLFSRKARTTQILILLNVLTFMAETACGGSTDAEALYRMGALFAPAVRAGEWWRLAAALFLHWGALHLAMNMFALWLLGPFVEFALGFRRFLLVYLLSGIGSMSVVIAFASGPNGEQLTVGASGCIMGLIGATGALMLRGWLRERAFAARRRLLAMLLIVVLQSLFDIMVPQVSMTAHLSGVFIGFAVTLLLRDHLRSAALPPPGPASSTGT